MNLNEKGGTMVTICLTDDTPLEGEEGRKKDTTSLIYVAAKATYICLLHGKIGFLGFFSALAP